MPHYFSHPIPILPIFPLRSLHHIALSEEIRQRLCPSDFPGSGLCKLEEEVEKAKLDTSKPELFLATSRRNNFSLRFSILSHSSFCELPHFLFCPLLLAFGISSNNPRLPTKILKERPCVQYLNQFITGLH